MNYGLNTMNKRLIWGITLLLAFLAVSISLGGAPQTSDKSKTDKIFSQLQLGFYAAKKGRQLNKDVGRKIGEEIESEGGTFKLKDVNQAPFFYQQSKKQGVRVAGNRRYAVIGLLQIDKKEGGIVYVSGKHLAHNLSQSLGIAQENVRSLKCEPPPQTVSEWWSQTCGNDAYSVFVGLNYEQSEIDQVADKILQGLNNYYQHYRQKMKLDKESKGREESKEREEGKTVKDLNLGQNRKDSSKYKNGEVFLVSDNNWRRVLQSIPVTTWTDQQGEIHKYPTLIYHQEKRQGKTSVDLDSINHFLRQYEPQRVSLVSADEVPAKIGDVLVAEIGGNVDQKKLQTVAPQDLTSYWQDIEKIVYVENNYRTALAATPYASLINSPLVIEGSRLAKKKTMAGKNLICVGHVTPSNYNAQCSQHFDLKRLRQAYVERTETNKIILTQPDDISHGQEFDRPFLISESTQDKFFDYLEKTSLVSAILAAARHELILYAPPLHGRDQLTGETIDSRFENKVKDFELPLDKGQSVDGHTGIYRQNIVYHDLNTGERRTILEQSLSGRWRQIKDLTLRANRIAWKQKEAEGWKLYSHNLKEKATRAIVDSVSDKIEDVTLGANKLIWTRKDGKKWKIAYHDFQQERTKLIEEGYTRPCEPKIYGKYIAYKRDGCSHQNSIGIFAVYDSEKDRRINLYDSLKHTRVLHTPLIHENNIYGVKASRPRQGFRARLQTKHYVDIDETFPSPAGDYLLDVLNGEVVSIEGDGIYRLQNREPLDSLDLPNIEKLKTTNDGIFYQEENPQEWDISLKFYNYKDGRTRPIWSWYQPYGSLSGFSSFETDGNGAVWNIYRDRTYLPARYQKKRLYHVFYSELTASSKPQQLTDATGIQVEPDVWQGKVAWINMKDKRETMSGFLTVVSQTMIPQKNLSTSKNCGYKSLDNSLYGDLDGDRDPDLGVGRITGLSTSDASTLLARSLFFARMPKNDKMTFLASDAFKTDGNPFPINREVFLADQFEKRGYQTTLATSREFQHDFDPSLWEDNYLISYSDHGLFDWAGIWSQDIPDLPNSQVVTEACKTCDITHQRPKNKESFCLQAIRHGAAFYKGAIHIRSASLHATQVPGFKEKFLSNIYYHNLPLGLAFSSTYRPDIGRTRADLILGDPALTINPPKRLKEPLYGHQAYKPHQRGKKSLRSTTGP